MLGIPVLYISQTTGTNINYTYRVFSEWLNMSDVGEKYNNTKNQQSICYLNISNDQIINYE